MMARRCFLISCTVMLAALATTTSTNTLRAAEPTVKLAIVVAKSSPLTALSGNELKRLYLGEYVSGPDSKKLIALNQAADSPDREGFRKVVIGMTSDEIGRYWIDRKIRGQSGPPKSVGSADQVRRVVARLEGAVGYVRVNEVNAEVKIVRIDGKTPDNLGYRVQY